MVLLLPRCCLLPSFISRRKEQYYSFTNGPPYLAALYVDVWLWNHRKSITVDVERGGGLHWTGERLGKPFHIWCERPVHSISRNLGPFPKLLSKYLRLLHFPRKFEWWKLDISVGVFFLSLFLTHTNHHYFRFYNCNLASFYDCYH